MNSLENRKELDLIELQMCDMQGRLFELAWKAGISSRRFIDAFMGSEIAAHLDMNFSFYQWAGEEYLFDELTETFEEEFAKAGEVYDRETMYWIGYIYRFWHCYTGEASKAIKRKAPPQLAERNYLMLHTMTPEMAVETFKDYQ